MKRLLIVVVGLAVGCGGLTGCASKDSDTGITVKDLRNRGKPADDKDVK